jgi:hypothetical protein
MKRKGDDEGRKMYHKDARGRRDGRVRGLNTAG